MATMRSDLLSHGPMKNCRYACTFQGQRSQKQSQPTHMAIDAVVDGDHRRVVQQIDVAVLRGLLSTITDTRAHLAILDNELLSHDGTAATKMRQFRGTGLQTRETLPRLTNDRLAFQFHQHKVLGVQLLGLSSRCSCRVVRADSSRRLLCFENGLPFRLVSLLV